VLVFGGLMLLGGRFADIFGSRSMMLTGVVIFTLASLANGLAQNEILLIGGRARGRAVDCDHNDLAACPNFRKWVGQRIGLNAPPRVRV
jgi:MFS family permease